MAKKTYIPGAAEDVRKAAIMITKHRAVILAVTAAIAPSSLTAVEAALDAIVSAAGVLEDLHRAYDPNWRGTPFLP